MKYNTFIRFSSPGEKLQKRKQVICMENNKREVRTVQEEMARERKFWKQNQLWSLLLVVVVLFGMLGKSGVSVAPGADTLMLSMHDGTTAALDYDDILSAELLDNPDFGTAAEGKETRTGKSGTWNHPQWGSYTLCVYSSCTSAVRMETKGQCYVVNLPSEEETRQLYQLIADKLPASR